MSRFIRSRSAESNNSRVLLTFGALLVIAVGCFAVVTAEKEAGAVKAATLIQTENTAVVESSVQSDAERPHNVVAAYYDVQNFASAKLLLNNKGLEQIEIRPTLFNLEGIAMEVAPVWVSANSSMMVDLRDWAKLGGDVFQQGSLRLFHTGKDLVIGSQVYLEDDENSIGFEERLAELGRFDSRRLEAIWTMPRNQCDAKIILSNTSDEVLSITATLSKNPHRRGDPQMFLLMPHQTRILDLRKDFSDGEQFANGRILGLSLEHNGANDALKTHGLVRDSSKGYSSIIRFSNPDTARSSEMHGTGLRLGEVAGDELEPVIAVKNLSSTRTTVNVRVPYTRADNTTGVVELRQVNLRAGEMSLLNMNPVIRRARREEIAVAGLEIVQFRAREHYRRSP